MYKHILLYDISHGIPSTSKKIKQLLFFNETCTWLTSPRTIFRVSVLKNFDRSGAQIADPSPGQVGSGSHPGILGHTNGSLGERDRESDHVVGTHPCCLGRERILVVSQVLGSLHRILDLVSRLLVDGLLHSYKLFCGFMFYNY